MRRQSRTPRGVTVKFSGRSLKSAPRSRSRENGQKKDHDNIGSIEDISARSLSSKFMKDSQDEPDTASVLEP